MQTEEIVSPLKNHVYTRNEAGGNAKIATGEKSPISISVDGDRVRQRWWPASPASPQAWPFLRLSSAHGHALFPFPVIT